MKRGLIIAAALLGLGPDCGRGAADSAPPDLDLAAIPKSVLEAPQPAGSASVSSGADSRIFLESALTGWVKRSDLLVPVPGTQPEYQERLSLDFSTDWKAARTLRFALSDRLNLFAGDTISRPGSANLRNDFREAFASLEIASQTFLEVGRINLKNGQALGYDPTDFFKARTQVSLASIDPSASRQNRLGVLMAEGQKLFGGGALTVAFAPEVQQASTLLARAPASFDPRFGQTNSSARSFASVSYDLLGLTPQVLVLHDEIGTHLGAALSRVVSNSVVVYAEWSGADSDSLTRRAVEFGQATGSLPAGAPMLLQASAPKRFQSDAVAGASWTSSNRLTLNVEFHYHQSGFTPGDFDRWIDLGRSNPRLASELWYIRSYATDQQEPLMQRQIFLRLAWADAFVRYLDLGLVSFVNPSDRSTLTQLSAQYAWSKQWTFGAYATGTSGAASREKSSIPWTGNVVLQVVRYW